MRVERLLLGMLAGNAVGFLLCALAVWLVPMLKGYSFVVSYPGMIVTPCSVGLAASWIWRPLRLGIGETVLHSLFCTAIGLAIAGFVFREGAICLLIIAPIIYAGVLAGALTGRTWFNISRDRLNVLLAPLVVAAIVAEPVLRTAHTSVVADELRIAAPPGDVWPHVLAFATIPNPPQFWLFRFGLPYPTETINSGNFVGADRACHFSGGAVFKEKVAELEPQRRLTFDIIEMPPDPELLGHLDATRGQFELRDNGDGTTTLIGRTWYSLHVRPAWYFDWWTHQIFRAVHSRVMEHIKLLAEKAP
jgi:hypothetical protein